MAVSTIIFGPTGDVASHAVQYVASKGAKVTLAMRNPAKTIPGLDSSQESSGNFTRVKADLTDPATVLAAAKEAQADTAFIYLVQGPKGTPRESIQALKDAGVKRVIFLSSFVISTSPPLREIPQADFIPWAHAQVEISLEEIFGDGDFISVRPAYFASNMFRYTSQIKAGTVKELYPDNKADFNSPRDIGQVCGYFLVQEQGPLPKTLEITGPQVVPTRQAILKWAKAAGKEVKIEDAEPEDAIQNMIKGGFPEPIARYLARVMKEQHEGKHDDFSGQAFKNGQTTVKKYLGREPETLDQWIEQNKAALA